MSTLRLSTHIMPAADLGSESPLPALRPYGNASTVAAMAKQAGPAYPDKGNENILLPYRIQSGYNRQRAPREFKTAVLENEFLRATFLLELGGRLWSLFDKTSNRELLYANPVFQPANLAIRSAWFTGGVEWNIGIFGHSVLTCEPIFAARVKGEDSEPVLRLYEWERAREVPFQIDFHLPDKSKALYSYVRIANPHDRYVPMYWWSNIAIPEQAGTRILAPANLAYRHNYTGELVSTTLPLVEGVDATYTTRVSHAADLYFAIPKDERKWIASADYAGNGLFQTSTHRLIGRKLFNWGTGSGGERWQDFLSGPGERYLEIQAGLAKTQSEYVHMPPKSAWDWAEAYGPFSMNANDAHGEWISSHQAAQRRLEQLLPHQSMNEFFERAKSIALRAPLEVLHHGQGWGALERRRRERAGEEPMVSAALVFPDSSMKAQQQPWLTLLETGELPRKDEKDDPGSLMVQEPWQALLEQAVAMGQQTHWNLWYHLGVMRYRRGDRAGAKAAWEQSVKLSPSAWAYRNLAELAIDLSETEASIDLLEKAVLLAPQVVPLIQQCCEWLLELDRPARAVSILNLAAPAIRNNGRIRLLQARAGLAVGNPAEAERFYGDGITIDDIREGEVSVTDVWYQWQALAQSVQKGVPNSNAMLEQVKHELEPPAAYEFRLIAPHPC